MSLERARTPVPAHPFDNRPSERRRPALGRRDLFKFLGAGAAGAVIGAGGAVALESTSPGPGSSVPFYGAHQAGIATPAQDRLHFAAFDMSPTATRDDLVTLLRKWTGAASELVLGKDIGTGAVAGPPTAPPRDTGEALGLAAARLTLTIGFGAGMFIDPAGTDRFGLANRRPAALAELPHFPGDALDLARSGGDLCVQACADDPQVTAHAVRNLARLARGTATVRYAQLGFGRTSSTSTSQSTPRNMMGFKDGTLNVKAEDTATMDTQVWVQPRDGTAWMTGGSYLVSRRIRMLIEPWDSTPLTEQERVIGRVKSTGAPMGHTDEFAALDLNTSNPANEPLIDPKAHVRLAHESNNGGAVILRRGYSFVDGADALGRLDAGLFFLAYQRDPRTQFVRIQNSLAGKSKDALNEYIQHVSSGLFACPPGVRSGEFWGQALFE